MVCRNNAQQQLPTQTLFTDARQNAAKEHRHQRGVFREGFNAIFNAMFAGTQAARLAWESLRRGLSSR
jgi:hypothetical protein